jgi:hypothetical protein
MSDASARRARRVVRLPGFVSEQPVGLGDVLKHATSTIGIRPCGGCSRRAEHLNRWVAFAGPRHGPDRRS